MPKSLNRKSPTVSKIRTPRNLPIASPTYEERTLIDRGFKPSVASNISKMKRNSEQKGLSKVQKLKDIENGFRY